MAKESAATITVTRASGERARGILRYGGKTFPVALGRAGIVANKFEGDLATPRGKFHPVRIWWRADRVSRPQTKLPLRRITRNTAWCEDPADRRYNRPFLLAENEKGDRLWREDHLYDLIVEIDHNRKPRTARRGSAVFLHLSRADFSPTAGCVGMPLQDLQRLVAKLDEDSVIRIL
jgi:L,D-peptidoglycan transpeptidase YkuD (ErfK/YbiS/YcfS/YnhG family)